MVMGMEKESRTGLSLLVLNEKIAIIGARNIWRCGFFGATFEPIVN
jgi:hypothetical protein